MVLTWPSLDGNEVSKAQHGCIDCLALMICAELQLQTLSSFEIAFTYCDYRLCNYFLLDLLRLSIKPREECSDKEKMAGVKLMASLMDFLVEVAKFSCCSLFPNFPPRHKASDKGEAKFILDISFSAHADCGYWVLGCIFWWVL
ncbi:hypothetical protein MKW98_011352 [Papaver atlanticum]|uniref:Uncharacterized protein n=1 Tax=Papaver atlanticum TaxID=357466 RepID=A0AAD4SVZ6_9MAGN|nr:hypothetical protein MKW98_011352 [Papaver atlanticum]